MRILSKNQYLQKINYILAVSQTLTKEKLLKYIFIRENPYCEVTNMQDCDINVIKFEFQLCYLGRIPRRKV